MDFGYEDEKKKPHCPIVDVDGVIANGKQFDLDITLPHDNRIKYQLYSSFWIISIN